MKEGVLGLVGPNGSGKTTFIRTLLGLVHPDRGECSVFGLDCWKDSLAIRKRLTVLHEKPYFIPSMRVSEYLRQVSNIYDRPARVDLLDSFGLDGERRIKSLSAGMYRKLGLMQALVCDPELVILDEPTSNLDPIARLDLLETIGRICREHGISFLISSHVLSEIEKIATETAIIYNGQLVEQGTPSELIAELDKENEYILKVSDLQGLLKKVEGLSYVDEARIVGDSLVIKTKEDVPDIFWQVASLARENGIRILGFSRKGGLEDVLRRVVNEQTKLPDRS
jgi:ABC-2 type transport system ATP-binding protein